MRPKYLGAAIATVTIAGLLTACGASPATAPSNAGAGQTSTLQAANTASPAADSKISAKEANVGSKGVNNKISAQQQTHAQSSVNTLVQLVNQLH